MADERDELLLAEVVREARGLLTALAARDRGADALLDDLAEPRMVAYAYALLLDEIRRSCGIADLFQRLDAMMERA